jgi:hypothetical protein
MGSRFYDPAAGQFLNQDSVTTSAQGDPAAGGDLHAYVNDSPVTGTDPSGHMLTAMGGGGCASAACVAAKPRALAPKPAPKSCSWYSLCGALHLYHAAVAKGKKIAARTIAVVRKAVTVVRHVAAVAVAKVSDAYHAAVTYAVRTVKAVARTAVSLARTAVHVVATAYHQTTAALARLKQAASATVKAAASFLKKHPAIASFGSGFANAFTSVAKGAIAQITHNIGLVGGCATGSLGACGDLWNQAGPNGAGYAALQVITGTVATGESIYHDYTHGQVSYATGRLVGYAAMFALTRGIGDALTPEAAGAAGATAPEAAPAPETFFRTMSKANLEQLQATGRVPATSETFISPSQEYAQGYEGTTVRFTARAGTQDALAGIGIRDPSAVASAAYPDMPTPQNFSGWTRTSAYFKGEGGVLNIGLGRGPALGVFNDAILGFEVVP